MTKEDVIEILERFVIGAKPCSQREIVDACASAYRMLKEQPSLPSNLDDAAEEIVKDWLAYGYGEYKKLVIAGAEWMFKKTPSEQAIAYVKNTHSSSEVSEFQAAMSIAAAKAFDEGAEWMAGQGETHELIVESPVLGPPMICCPVHADNGDKVVVQIRKK